MSQKLKSKNRHPALLVVNGTLPREDILRRVCDQSHLIVCTDGAADQLRRLALEIRPAAIIGDLDSLECSSFYDENTIIRIDDQESTDLEKALGYLIEKQPEPVVVIGFFGSRYDHSITNLQILSSFHEKLDFLLVDDYGYGLFLSRRSNKRSVVINEAAGTTVSLLPIGRISGITTEGLDYPLDNEVLGWGIRSGQSNRMSGAQAKVELQAGEMSEDGEGTLLIYVLPVDFGGLHIRARLL